MEKEIEITNLEELDVNKLYAITLPADTSQLNIQSFAAAVHAAGLKALIVRDGVNFSSFVDMFKDLPEDKKKQLLDVLNQPTPVADWVESVESEGVNPLAHEQTK